MYDKYTYIFEKVLDKHQIYTDDVVFDDLL